ncbi:hypothetical protein [Streptomyces shenzhenensis]|uniref:Uncharacterized protein n=1 Tax=Streptomyces shenzhenensis TaxID=943815 RepID=A0A3M0I4B3_9ACTN|nr:hypothetical protein [Streptomyces shenzhenensis]RMB83675.1 hypothetical protein CTZ28_23450 [Streptomyces shenzhenensis]
MDQIHPRDRYDLDDYTRGITPATFADVTNAAALARKTLRSNDIPPRATALSLARALLAVSRRLLAAEDAHTDTRLAVACHVAAADAGDDPTPADLLATLTKAGQPLGDDMLAHGRAEHTAATAAPW